MDPEQLKIRFKQFVISVIDSIKQISAVNETNRILCRQLIRSASSSGANYRAACRAKSKPDFIHKLKIVEEELDESIYWMELLQHFNPSTDFAQTLKECDELLAITVSSVLTVRRQIQK